MPVVIEEKLLRVIKPRISDIVELKFNEMKKVSKI
jgi:hypothetical protein